MIGDDSAVASRPNVEAPFQWEVRLWRTGEDKRIVVFMCAVLASIAGWLLVRNAVVAAFGLLAILGSTTEYWLPQKYRLDRNGAKMQCGISVTSIDWKDVKRIVTTEEGVKLSPLEGEGTMSRFRGLYLRFAGNREEVMSKIDELRELELGTVG